MTWVEGLRRPKHKPETHELNPRRNRTHNQTQSSFRRELGHQINPPRSLENSLRGSLPSRPL